MINKKDLPLVLVKAIQSLYDIVRKFASENDDVLEIIKDDENLNLVIKDYGENSKFTFTINKPRYIKNTCLFTINYNPTHQSQVDSNTLIAEAPTVIQILKNWNNIIREYNESNINPSDKFFNYYKKEFYDKFEIIDEDADTKPFDVEKQLVIHVFLVEAIKVLNKNEVDNKEIIQDAVDLKDNIHNLTKNGTIKRLGVLYAKTRKKGLDIFKDIFLAAKKELMKRGVSGVFDFISENISNLLN